MKRIYLDYAASTPVAPEVLAAMQPYFRIVFGNPSSLHMFGQEASAAVFRARETVAGALGCNYKEIVFTGSATEANNLALRGATQSAKRSISRPRIITSVIEHESVLETCRALEDEGVEVVYIPVDRAGIIDLQKLKAALNERTVLVSVMHANNEIGVIQPIAEVANIIHEFRAVNGAAAYPLFHSDAAQSFQYCDCNVDALGVDLLTISGQKIYGPKGVGALYVRQGAKHEAQSENHSRSALSDLRLAPVITGSGQERGLRSGTENVPGIVGLAGAVGLAAKLRAKESARVKKLRDYFWKRLQQSAPNAEVNGTLDARLPNNLNVYFPGHSAGDIVITLDVHGIAASPGAACRSRAAKESYVIEALGYDDERASQSVRFSLGRGTSTSDVDRAIAVLKRIVLQVN